MVGSTDCVRKKKTSGHTSTTITCLPLRIWIRIWILPIHCRGETSLLASWAATYTCPQYFFTMFVVFNIKCAACYGIREVLQKDVSTKIMTLCHCIERMRTISTPSILHASNRSLSMKPDNARSLRNFWICINPQASCIPPLACATKKIQNTKIPCMVQCNLDQNTVQFCCGGLADIDCLIALRCS